MSNQVKYCTECGKEISSKAVVCLRFYLGRNKYGIISIIFFWTFIPFIISCLHGVKLLQMSDEDFNLLYC